MSVDDHNAALARAIDVISPGPLPGSGLAAPVSLMIHGTLAKRMPLDVSVVRDIEGLNQLAPAWKILADQAPSPGGMFRGPSWLLPWWHAFHKALSATAMVLAAYNDGELVGILPLYRHHAKYPLFDVVELRMMGDAGPRPPALDLATLPGWEERVATQFAKTLLDEHAHWDVLALEPLADPSLARATLISRLASAGHAIRSSVSAGGAVRIALALAPLETTETAGVVTTYGQDMVALRKGLSTLRRLSRLEWAEREEHSPLAETETTALLEEAALELSKENRVRLARLDDAAGEAVAAALIIDDGDRAVVLAMAVDPHTQLKHASVRLLHAAAVAARQRGRSALEVVGGAVDHPLPTLPTSKYPALAVRVWSHSKSAAIARGYESVAKQARRAKETPSIAAAQARAAWSKLRGAAANVAHYERFCLYRGQLWTRNITGPAELRLSHFTAENFEGMDPSARADLVEQLHFDETTARQRWHHGDIVMLATLSGRPAGIVWCARGDVRVPEIGRDLKLGKYDVYIRDIFVAPGSRGRAVAPVMLEGLTKELRDRDVYRSWALIDANNQASLRAFQKASFAPVCDVIHAKMATVDRLIVRPPDPEARELLGL